MRMILCNNCIRNFRRKEVAVYRLERWEGEYEMDFCDNCDGWEEKLWLCEVEERGE